MRAGSFGKAFVAGILLLAVFEAGVSIADGGRLGQTLRAFRDGFQTVEGERPPLNPLDRLVLSVILAESKARRD